MSDVVRSDLRDPAWRTRVGWTLAALVVSWPLLVMSEFKPWTLIGSDSANAALGFIASFLPPQVNADFLRLVVRETWITVAIATSGLTLAVFIAVPMTVLATSALSISRLGRERMATASLLMRQGVRAVSILLRSVPELVFALLFVRVVGLGPTAGVLAIGLAYGGMLAKVFAEIIESTDRAPTQALLANGRRTPVRTALRRAAASRLGARVVPRLPLGVRDSRVGDHGLRRCGRPRSAHGRVDEDVQRRRDGDDADRVRAAGVRCRPGVGLSAASAGVRQT